MPKHRPLADSLDVKKLNEIFLYEGNTGARLIKTRAVFCVPCWREISWPHNEPPCRLVISELVPLLCQGGEALIQHSFSDFPQWL